MFERATSSAFTTPFDLGPTDSLGAASTTVGTGTWYARQKTAPTGWQALTQLDWNNSLRNYTGSATVNTASTATASISSSNGNSTRFVQRLVNPETPAGCGNGLKVLLLLDTSGSTSGHGNAYKKAANTFIDTLSDTPTKLKVSTFNTQSYPDNATQYDLNTAGGQTDARNRIAGIYPSNSSGSGFTNWDEALQDAGGAGVDVVVMVTDGNPTTHQGGSTNNSTGIADITYAVASANHAKNPGHTAGGPGSQTILAVGVGTNLARENLQAISGPAKNTDWTDAAEPDELAATLKAVANRICGGTLTINKSLSPKDDPGKFNLLVNGSAKAENVGDGGTTGKLDVDAGKYTLTEQIGSASPTLLTDYSSSLECKDKDGSVSVSAEGIVEVKGGQDVTCTWTNTRKTGTLTVVKSLSPAADPGLFTLRINGNIKAENVGDGGSTGPQAVATGKQTISEEEGSSSPVSLSQ
ncbi:MAG: vWA domain-containing protein, partial [Bacteroidota bacterium]